MLYFPSKTIDKKGHFPFFLVIKKLSKRKKVNVWLKTEMILFSQKKGNHVTEWKKKKHFIHSFTHLNIDNHPNIRKQTVRINGQTDGRTDRQIFLSNIWHWEFPSSSCTIKTTTENNNNNNS